jgi:hypothetical protein
MLKRTSPQNITYLSPQLNTNQDKYFMQPLDIYDAYVANSDQSGDFKTANQMIKELGFQAEPLGNTLNSDSKQLQTWQSMYDLSTKGPNTLFFHTTDGKKIEIYSPETFRPGSSLHHIATSFASTDDFVMVPSLKNSVTVEDLMRNANSTTVYGKGIRSIMTSIGWPTIDNPETQIIQIAVDYGLGFRTAISVFVILLNIALLC